VKHRPFTNQPERRLRLNVARDHLTAEVELPVLPLMLGVEMRGLVLLVVHAHDDSEEDRNDGHSGSIPSSDRAGARLIPRRDLSGVRFDPDVDGSAV